MIAYDTRSHYHHCMATLDHVKSLKHMILKNNSEIFLTLIPSNKKVFPFLKSMATLSGHMTTLTTYKFECGQCLYSFVNDSIREKVVA